MIKHTPKPWIIRGKPNLLCVVDKDSDYIVDRFVLGDRPYEEHLANARLIAAAPELLEALAELTRIIGNRFEGLKPRELRMAFDAANKALKELEKE
jgi:hypothetical protein